MKKYLKFFTIMLAVLAVMMFSLSVNAEVVKWDLPTVWAATNYQSRCLKIFADEVKEATDGQVEIILHYGGALKL